MSLPTILLEILLVHATPEAYICWSGEFTHPGTPLYTDVETSESCLPWFSANDFNVPKTILWLSSKARSEGANHVPKTEV